MMPGTNMTNNRIDAIYVSELAETLSGGCRYRLFLNSPPNNQDLGEIMPLYPQAIVGKVFHNVFKEISDGMHLDTDLQLLLRNRTESLADNYYNSGRLLNVPNFKSAKYEREFRNKAVGLEERRASVSQSSNSKSRTIHQSVFRTERKFGREIRVEGFERLVVGIIDEVRYNNDRIEIIDDKTGKIDLDSVSLFYQNQLLIYALLWAEKWGKEVNSVAIRNSEGKIIWDKELSNYNFQNLTNEINTILEQFKDISQFLELANPNHDNCNFCEHRVTCLPHRQLINIKVPDQACFFLGTIMKVFFPPGSKMKLTVRIDEELYQTEVSKSCMPLNNDELPINAEFHAFYLDSKRPRQLNPRKKSYKVIAIK